MEQKVFSIKVNGVKEFKSLNDIVKTTASNLTDMKEKQLALNEALKDSSLSVEEVKKVNKELNILDKTVTDLGKTSVETKDSFKGVKQAFDGVSKSSVGLLQTFAGTSSEGSKLSSTIEGMVAVYTQFGGTVKTLKGSLVSTFENSSSAAQKFGNITKIAIASTGIGLLLVALVGLIAYFKTSQEAADRFAKVFGGLNQVFNFFIKSVAFIGENLVKAFDNPKQAIINLGESIKANLINRFVALKEILVSITTGDFSKLSDSIVKASTGIDGLVTKTEAFAKATKEAYLIGEQIAKQKIKIELLEINNNKLSKESLRDRERLRNIQDNEFKTTTQKLNAAKEIIKLADSELKRQEELYKVKIETAKLESKANGNKREDLKAISELEAELAEKQEENAGVRSEQVAFESALRKSVIEESLALEKQSRDIRAALIEDEYTKLKVIAENAKKDAEIEVKKSIATEESKRDARLAINQQYQKSLKDIEEMAQNERSNFEKAMRDRQITELDNELERNIRNIQAKLEDDKVAAEKTIKDKQVLLETISLLESNAQEDITNLTLKAEKEKAEKIAVLQKELLNTRSQILIENLEYNNGLILKATELTEKERFDLIKANEEAIFNERTRLAKENQQSELDNLNKLYESKLISTEEYNLKSQILLEKGNQELSKIQKEYDEKSITQSKETSQQIIDNQVNQLDSLKGLFTNLTNLSNALFEAQTSVFRSNIASIDEELESIREKKSLLDEELNAIDERYKVSQENISSLEEDLAKSTGGLSFEIQAQLDKEREKQDNLSKSRKDAVKEINRLKAAEKLATEEKVKQGKKIEEAQKKQALVANLLTLAQTGLAIASIAASSAKQDFTFGIATVASIVAVGAALITNIFATKASLEGFAEGGLVPLSGQKINPSDGIQSNFSNGDNMIASVKTGEVILNERQQQLLGGEATFSKLGLKGFADGGLVTTKNTSSSSSIPSVNNIETVEVDTNSNILALIQNQNTTILALASRPIYTSLIDIDSATETFKTQQSRITVI